MLYPSIASISSRRFSTNPESENVFQNDEAVFLETPERNVGKIS